MEIVHIAQNNSGSYNINVDPDLSCLNLYSVSSSYYTLEQLTTSVNTVKGLSIIHIHCRSLNAKFCKFKDVFVKSRLLT